MKIRKVTWEEVEKICASLSQTIGKLHNDAFRVYGIPKGGMVGAVYISSHTDIKLASELNFLETTDVLWERKKYIMVLDVNTTGATISEYNKHNKNVMVAMFERPAAQVRAHIVGEVIDNDVKLVLPWERME